MMEVADQAMGPLAAAKIEVDQGCIRRRIGNQALGFGCTRSRPDYIGSQGLKQVAQADSKVPRVLNQQDAQAPESRRIGFGPMPSVRQHHDKTSAKLR